MGLGLIGMGVRMEAGGGGWDGVGLGKNRMADNRGGPNFTCTGYIYVPDRAVSIYG